MFAANAYFWSTAGYFEAAAEVKPLLHTWSLAVEEQFYIFYPVLLLVLQRYLPRRVVLILVIACLASFAASVIFIHGRPMHVFYLPHYRAWELFLGVLLALRFLPPVASRRVRDGMSLLGVVLIGCGVYFLSESSVFPRATALLPCVGTALLIHAGSDSTVVGRLLGFRPLVFVGLISYSLYLWHWPLIMFTKYFLIRDLFWPEKMALFGVSVVLATISWRFVELPFRSSRGLMSRRSLFAAAAAMSTLFIMAALAGLFLRGLPRRVPPDVLRLASAGRVSPSTPCFFSSDDKPLAEQACHLGADGLPSFLLWGDSEAIPLVPVFDEVAKRRGLTRLAVGGIGCPPLLGVERYDENRHCARFSARVVSLLEQHPEIKRVVLVGRWGLNSLGPRYGQEGGKAAVISPLGLRDNPRAFHQGLEQTFTYLEEHGKEVVFVTSPPEIGWDVAEVLARARWFGRPVPSGPSLAAYRERQRVVTSSPSYPVS